MPDFDLTVWDDDLDTYMDMSDMPPVLFDFTLSGAGLAPDIISPTITNLTPAPGTPLNRFDFIEFDVADAAPGLRFVGIIIKQAHERSTEVIHDGSTFLEPFNTDSVRTGSAVTGYHYKVRPNAGWLSAITRLHTYAVDQAGNLEGGLP